MMLDGDDVYEVPHFVHELPFKHAELMVLIVLHKLKSDWDRTHNICSIWFLTTNEAIAEHSKLSLRTVRRARIRLHRNGYVRYWPGTRATGNRTKYWLLPDRGSDRSLPKTNN